MEVEVVWVQCIGFFLLEIFVIHEFIREKVNQAFDQNIVKLWRASLKQLLKEIG